MTFALFLVVLLTVIFSLSNRAQIHSLEKQISLLSHRLDKLALSRTQEQGELSKDAAATFSSMPPKTSEDLRATQNKNPWTPDEDNRFSDEGVILPWLRENWLLALGGFFMLFAMGWLARYSIMNNLIGPVGRIICGLVLGTGILGFSERRIQTHRQQGGIFAVLGSAIIVLTVCAGYHYYDMFTPIVAMAVMFMTVVFVSFLSVRYNFEALSYAGLAIAGLLPVLVSSGHKDFVGLFSYLALVTAGALWVVFLTNWRKNIAIAVSVVFLYSLPVLSNPYSWMTTPWLGLLFIFGFAATFFATTFISHLQHGGKTEPTDLFSATLSGLLLIVWIWVVSYAEWQVFLLLGWALLFCAATYHLATKTKEPSLFYVYGGVSTLLLSTALTKMFQGPALTLAFIAEATLLPLISWGALRHGKYAIKTSFLMIVPFLLSYQSLNNLWDWRRALPSHAIVTLAMTLAPLGLAYFLRSISKDKEDLHDSAKKALLFHVGTGTLFGGFFIWNFLHTALMVKEIATILALVIFTATGLLAYIYGYLRAQKPVKIYGGIIIAWVSLRLIFIDMPQMEVGGKVAVFFILGTLLLGTAFVEHKGKKLSS